MKKVPVALRFAPVIFQNDYRQMNSDDKKAIIEFMNQFPNGTKFTRERGNQFLNIDIVTKKNEQCFALLVGDLT